VYAPRRNWDSPNPFLANECSPPPNSDEGHTLWYSLYVRTLCPVSCKEQRGHILSLFSLILPDGEGGVYAVHAGRSICPAVSAFKGSPARDFRPQVFSMNHILCVLCTMWPSISAHSAGAYIATLWEGVYPAPSSAWANFSIMIECTPESGCCHSVCTLWRIVSASSAEAYT
jgi:hypothetical protein